jgi:RNA polymerase primary sigma factor
MKGEDSKEIIFVKSLEKVRQIARAQGNCIRGEQVRAELSALNLNENQMEMVYDYLTKHKIMLGEPAEGECMATDEFSGPITEEEKNYLQDYLDEIAKLPVYDENEIKAYTIGAMSGDAKALKCLAESYLKDVADIARMYTGQGVSLEDLIGEGNVALTMGLGELHRLEQGSDAREMLAKRVMDAMEAVIEATAEGELADKKAEDRVNLVAKKARELAEVLHRKVTAHELAEETDFSVEEIEDAMRMSGYKIEDLRRSGG